MNPRQKKTKKDLWFGASGCAYHEDEPAFFGDDDLPGAEVIKAHYSAIKKELAPLMAAESNDMPPYFNELIQSPPKSWKASSFFIWGKQNRKAVERFPAVGRLVEAVPGCVSASISMLEPGAEIKAHYGECNACYRVHLGLDIPAGLPECGFQVKDETRAWGDGELLIFLDANWHAAFNRSNRRRYVLILDVMRPEFAHLEKYVCVRSLSFLSVLFLVSLLPNFILRPLLSPREVSKSTSFIVKFVLLPFQLGWSLLWRFRLFGVNAARGNA